MATTETLITAEEYARLVSEDDRPSELIRGRIVYMNMPFPRHGVVCAHVARILGNFVEERDLGRVMSNDSGVVTGRVPDTVRGADVAYYSYGRLPRGPLPDGYPPQSPELVFEVLSPSDRQPEVLAKVVEYLNAGVARVCVLDAERETVTVYSPDRPEERLSGEEKLTLPRILPGFGAAVERFFV